MRSRLFTAAACAATLAGCGVSNPYATPPRQPAPPAHEADRSLPAIGMSGRPRDPRQAAAQYSELAGTWTAATLGRTRQAQARRAVGPERERALRQASLSRTASGRPPHAARSVLTVRGVLAAGPPGRRRRFLVVARQHVELGKGRGGERAYRVISVDVVQVRGRWAVQRWEPQP
jgi:predicted small lipoprotein YifL